MSAEDVVNRLEHCRQVSPDSWIARCPAHDDSSPSLSIKDVGGGRTLIHCHAGCGALEVLDALGLDWGALYPPTDQNYKTLAKRREKTIDEFVVDIALADLRAGKTLKETDKQRCREALLRMEGAA